MTFVQKFYLADPHFGHHGILRMLPASRPFDTIEEHDRAIVERVNARVGGSDLLYILGDFALSSDAAYVRFLFESLNGRKVLLIGNHDLDRKGRLLPSLAALPWDAPPREAMEVRDGGERLYLSHYAHRVWPAAHHGSWHFYGHSHAALPSLGRSRDVGLDMPDMELGPRTFAELTAGMDNALRDDFGQN